MESIWNLHVRLFVQYLGTAWLVLEHSCTTPALSLEQLIQSAGAISGAFSVGTSGEEIEKKKEKKRKEFKLRPARLISRRVEIARGKVRHG